MTDAQREQFERYFIKPNQTRAMLQRESENGNYVLAWTQGQWESWQAAYDAGAAAENEACAKISDEHLSLGDEGRGDGYTDGSEIAAKIRARRKGVES